MMKAVIRTSILAVMCLGAGCTSEPPASGEDSGADAAVEQRSGPLLPWKEGNTWTYQVTEDGEESTKIVTVGAEEEVGGSGPHATDRANKVVTKKGQSDQTVSWQTVESERVVRYREQSFSEKTGALTEEEHWEPHKLHVDMSAANTKEGASWVESYAETKLPVDGEPSTETERDVWSVDAVDQVVTVPAGTFRAIVLQKAGSGGLKTYWYVPGVGKVKETGGQTELLVSYEVQP